MDGKLVLVDGHSILNRAFFGIPDLTNSEGLHTNAVYGFLNILFKILDEEQPDYLTVAFDVHAPTFRHKMYDAYKGTRKPMADELRQQVPLMKEMLTAMGVTIVEKEGYEADDLLGTIAKQSEEQGLEVSIVSGDRDLLQLASDHIKIRIPKTKRTGTEIEDYLAKDVVEKYQVTPLQFIDVKALMGDSADNIPGVPGIGEKTATALITAYGSIENAHDHLEEIKPNRAKQNLSEHYDMAQMSKELATIEIHAPIEYSLEDAKLGNLFTEEAYLMCKRLEFKNMLSRFDIDAPKNLAEEHFTFVTDKKQISDIFKKAKKAGHIGCCLLPGEGIITEQLSLFEQPKEQQVIEGMSIAFSEEDIYYLSAGTEVSAEELLEEIRELSGGQTKVSVMDLKETLKTLPLPGNDRYFDASVAAYLLNPLKNDYPYEDLAKDYAGLMIPSRTDLLGKESPVKAKQAKPEAFLKYICYMAYIPWKTRDRLLEELNNTGMQTLYDTIELPLVYTLSDMEKEGVHVDAEELKRYGEELAAQIAVLEKEIYEGAGETFNINSPKQLGHILFEKLEMPYGKKTKTGYSTAADVLEKLAVEYPLVSKILEYRQLAKLKSTYADGLANFIEEDGRIHTNFQQTVTATGRLSSTDPNLQNIPIRMELGRMIRKVFLPKDGYVFVDADYSQIELRILAHMSGDEMLIQAYREAQDIHRMTASQVFHTPFEEVTDLQRRNAKAVNFGIVYGISSFGLSQDLSISKKEAQEYIERYFESYPKIKEFLDGCVEKAKKDGYSVTMFGRRRPLPEISSSNFMQRSFGERIAMNAPIQGTAADIIKIAMNRVHRRLIDEGLKSRLLLQVHDELLIEAAPDEVDEVKKILDEEMKGAADLSVELEIDTHTGKNWYEAK
ncbi:DNA polymerase I [Lachnospiraceae bacterium CLA-AA-H185]|uniref:DNA polymerase I n=1 Tax=Maccoyibacter intestinihominis TaxID=3133499 RepID=A0ABV1HC20_9FIRM|nr:MAG: DNA polymerase I [Clostridiales bacterium 41_12_two_minus]